MVAAFPIAAKSALATGSLCHLKRLAEFDIEEAGIFYCNVPRALRRLTTSLLSQRRVSSLVPLLSRNKRGSFFRNHDRRRICIT
jgi:hypothetical protein